MGRERPAAERRRRSRNYPRGSAVPRVRSTLTEDERMKLRVRGSWLPMGVAVVSASLLGACVVAAPPPPGGPYVAMAPPAPQVEVVGVAPAPGYFWIGGFWGWEGGRHVWFPGRWEAPRPGYRWVPHAWVREGGGYRMHEGHWERH